MRLRELTRLTFDDIDWEARELVLPPPNKRQAVARLSYGRGVESPGHILAYPAGPNPVPVGHQSVTGAGEVS
jgi:hypothetical protein